MKLHEAAVKLLKNNLALKKGEKVAVVSDMSETAMCTLRASARGKQAVSEHAQEPPAQRVEVLSTRHPLQRAVLDRKRCDVFDAVCKAAEMLGGKVEKIKITNKRMHGQPLPHLKKKFCESDVIIGITDKSISHCPELKLARTKGARAVTMPGVKRELFLKAMKANQMKIKKLGIRLRNRLKCRKIKITSPSGTNLEINAIKNIDIDDGDSTKKGTLNNVPFGEVCMIPISIANGILAIDFSRMDVNPKDKVKLTLKNGMIISYNNKKAKKFADALYKIDGKKAQKVVELGLGINPEHKTLIGSIIHDEKIYGSAHIAFGGYGTIRKCKLHEDVILLKPTVWADKKVIVKNGKIL